MLKDYLRLPLNTRRMKFISISSGPCRAVNYKKKKKKGDVIINFFGGKGGGGGGGQ